MWPWKLVTSKECVIAHLPNEVAPQMEELNPLCSVEQWEKFVTCFKHKAKK
jgi:hypothetical protein